MSIRALACFLLLALVPSLSYSSYAGRVVAEVEKEWDIISNGTLRDATLNSSFLLVSPYQAILEMNTTDGELVRTGDEIRLHYYSPSLQAPKKITAKATVEVSYFPLMGSNPPLPNRTIAGSGYTNYTPAMAEFARSYTSESAGQLDAMASLTEWVHKNVKYDTKFWGSASPATEVYSERNAVCVGYTHLLLALANSLGIENRYVSGYVFSDGWQQHAWAELKIGDQWIPADPTFEEFGYLDARRIASSYSADQSGAVDRLSAKGGPFSFSTVFRVRISESTPFPPLASAYAAYDGTQFSVIISNPGGSYATPTYLVTFPPYIHAEDSGILFLPPGGRKVLSYYLNTDALSGSSLYRIPYMVTMQGTEVSDTITYSRTSGAGATGAQQPCAIALALLSTFIFAVKCRKDNKCY